MNFVACQVVLGPGPSPTPAPACSTWMYNGIVLARTSGQLSLLPSEDGKCTLLLLCTKETKWKHCGEISTSSGAVRLSWPPIPSVPPATRPETATPSPLGLVQDAFIEWVTVIHVSPAILTLFAVVLERVDGLAAATLIHRVATTPSAIIHSFCCLCCFTEGGPCRCHVTSDLWIVTIQT
jgi:hypothetical protein